MHHGIKQQADVAIACKHQRIISADHIFNFRHKYKNVDENSNLQLTESENLYYDYEEIPVSSLHQFIFIFRFLKNFKITNCWIIFGPFF